MTLAEVAAALHKDVAHLRQHVAEQYWEVERSHRKRGKGVVVHSGEYTSPDRIQWVYVVTLSPSKTTLYPMAWYFTREGIHSFQIDADGPATYMRPHVLERYRKRYYPHADVLGALLQMHTRNYDKACEPRHYRGRPAIASAVEDGYFLGDEVCKGTVVDLHTFYDVQMGAKEHSLRNMRKLLEWRRYLVATNPNVGRSDGYVNWGHGFPVRLERLRRAA
ncbi:MAG: hypothetical protein ACOH13_14375 [Flavobacteriales bacterium]